MGQITQAHPTVEEQERLNPRIFLLALGMFALGTDAFIVAGVLPVIAQETGVTEGLVGQLVTAFTVISNQAHSTKGRSKRYTCSSELLNALGKGYGFHLVRPIEKARASPAMFLRATGDEKVALRAPQ